MGKWLDLTLSDQDPKKRSWTERAMSLPGSVTESLESPAQTEEIEFTTGLQDPALRGKMSFARKPEDKLKILQTKYPDAQLLPTGALVYRNPESGKLTAVDEKGFSTSDIAEISGMMPEIIGGTVGAGLGSIVPGMTAVGAGIGTAGGSMVKRAIGDILTPGGTEITPEEAKKETLWAGIAGLAGEGFGGAVTRGLSFGAKRMTEPIRRAKTLFRKYGGELTPGQTTGGMPSKTAEALAEGSFFGGAPVSKFRQQQQMAGKRMVDTIVDRMGTKATPEEVGTMVQGALEGRVETFKAAASGIYDEVDKLAAGTNVSTKSVRETAQKILSRISPEIEVLSPLGDPSLVKLPTIQSTKLLDLAANLPDEVPFAYLQNLRSDLFKVGYSTTELVPGKTIGQAKALAKAITDTFESPQGGLSTEARQALVQANKFWKQGKDYFNSTLMKSVVKKNPEAVADIIYQYRKPTATKEIMAFLSPQEQKQLRGHFVNKLLLDKTTMDVGEETVYTTVSGTKLQAELNKIGQESLEAILPRPQIRQLKSMADILQRTQRKIKGTGMDVVIKLAQGGALLSLGTLGYFGRATGLEQMAGSAAILIGPYGMAKLLTSTTGIRWLTEGLIRKAGTKAGVHAASRILSIVGKENVTAIKPEEEQQ